MAIGLRVITLITTFVFSTYAVEAQEVPFTRGINLTNWFQTGSPQQIQLGKYTQEDFENIKSLGCDVIRLPINLHAMTNGTPNYQLDPLFLEFLDHAVDLAETSGMYLILDNHTFDPAVGTDPNIGFILEKVWSQMAEHYKDRTELLMYEVLNEPHDISDQQWNDIQQGVVDAIRAVDDQHFIVIGPAGWNSFHNLDAMPVYTQEKLIYTFHFYDPFIFTHQGATWVDPSMAPLGQVPFPYSSQEMPQFPSSLSGTWIETAFNDYIQTGTVSDVKRMIDIAVDFRDSRNVPIYCGEFGAYIPNSDNQDRVNYYEVVRSYLEEKDIAWTMWDYHGGFGLFKEGGNGLFDHNLNVELLEALGFEVPAQTPFVKQPETTGFLVYTDFIEGSILESSSGESQINFYSTDSPNNGEYCIKWEESARYQNVGFDLSPNKDLSQLVDNGYALDFIFRGTAPVAFDLRFVDSDQGTEDHPWRMNYKIDETVVDYDSRWHHLHIPLSSFYEGGAWEGEFYPAEDKFDWADIDRLEIVAEHADLRSTRLWFDNIIITDQDTAQVHDNTVFEDVITSLGKPGLESRFRAYPNPVGNELFIKDLENQPGVLAKRVILRDAMGRLVRNGSFKEFTILDTSGLSPGVYYLQIDQKGQTIYAGPLIKNR